MSNKFTEIQANRRTIYALGKNVSQSKAEIADLIKEAVKLSPTAFNSQTVRAVVTFGEASDKVWDIVLAELKKVAVSEEAFAKTNGKNQYFQGRFWNGALFHRNCNC